MANVAARWNALAAVVVLSAATARGVAAGPRVIVGGIGLVHLEKRTPAPVSTTSIVVRLEGGWRLGPRTAARLRVEGFRVDGVNLFSALAVDVDVASHVGLSAFAGVSAGARSGLGSYLGAGVFGRWWAQPTVAIRADASVSSASRNDFGGFGAELVVGLEWRP